MKKKIILTIILGVVMLGIITAGVVLAQSGPPVKLQECCKLQSDVKIKKGTITVNTAGSVRNEADTANLTSNYVCKKSPGAACLFKKDFTVGKTGATRCRRPILLDPDATAPVDAAIDSWGMICIINTVKNVTDWIFYLVLIAVVLLGVIGGALYMTSAGDADKAGKGKSVIIYAVIGLVLALISKLIPSVVKMVMGMG